ncbi:MAG: hypothetical protein FJ264_15170 [Planctomycetes bacterium]|nr:hypothetical protein [Planctomycetota bacterium]
MNDNDLEWIMKQCPQDKLDIVDQQDTSTGCGRILAIQSRSGGSYHFPSFAITSLRPSARLIKSTNLFLFNWQGCCNSSPVD